MKHRNLLLPEKLPRLKNGAPREHAISFTSLDRATTLPHCLRAPPRLFPEFRPEYPFAGDIEIVAVD